MAKHTYRVERHMQGDRFYVPGETRDLTPAEAAHLVAARSLIDLGPAAGAKAEPELKNKAEPPLENKAPARTKKTPPAPK